MQLLRIWWEQLRTGICAVLKLVAHASFEQLISDAPQPLRAMVESETGKRFRRVNRYIELCLIGAARCLRKLPTPPPPDTALYLCSDTGMLDQTASLMHRMQSRHGVPKPYEFMNLSGTMAAFQVAQHFTLTGPQLCLHGQHDSLEQALQLMFLRSSHHRRALVGVVEEGCWPLATHRQRLEYNSESTEHSHWFYFDQDATAPMAVITHCESGSDLKAVISEADLAKDRCRVSGSVRGRWRAPLADWGRRLHMEPIERDARISEGSGLVSATLARFANGDIDTDRLIHINQTDAEEFVATHMRRD